MILEQEIYRFLPSWFKINDPNKNISGEGTIERFFKLLASELDDYFLAKLIALQANTKSVSDIPFTLMPYEERLRGTDTFGINDLATYLDIRRKILLYAERLHQHKGTTQALETIFYWLGFYDITFEEVFPTYFSFDIVIEFDNANRHFDNKCSQCSILNIMMNHDNLTNELKDVVKRVVRWGVPWRVLTFVFYNGDTSGIGIFDDTFDDTFE